MILKIIDQVQSRSFRSIHLFETVDKNICNFHSTPTAPLQACIQGTFLIAIRDRLPHSSVTSHSKKYSKATKSLMMREEMNRRLAVIELFPARLANRVERDCGINVTGSRLRNSISLSPSLFLSIVTVFTASSKRYIPAQSASIFRKGFERLLPRN